jgi:hypothetical protein
MRVGAAALPISFPLQPKRHDEREQLVSHCLEHLLRRGLLEARSAEMILVRLVDRLLDRRKGAHHFALLERIQLVESLDEQQVGELLDDRERVGDAARPHRVPDAVDFGFEFAGDHWIAILVANSMTYCMDITRDNRLHLSSMFQQSP